MIVVPAAAPVVIIIPTVIVPLLTLDTVNVVLEIEPVKVARNPVQFVPSTEVAIVLVPDPTAINVPVPERVPNATPFPAVEKILVPWLTQVNPSSVERTSVLPPSPVPTSILFPLIPLLPRDIFGIVADQFIPSFDHATLFVP